MKHTTYPLTNLWDDVLLILTFGTIGTLMMDDLALDLLVAIVLTAVAVVLIHYRQTR